MFLTCCFGFIIRETSQKSFATGQKRNYGAPRGYGVTGRDIQIQIRVQR
jgi:hypothetical protein